VSWDSRFTEPIVLPDGIRLASLRETIAHLVKTIPAAERRMPVVLAAAERLTEAAEHGGRVEFARTATLQALNRHFERTFDPERQASPWERRKPKQDTA
jgi:hypothetical protein